jgi:sn-glycerol 3-phosphate transport system substrate-binding protein
MTIGTSAALGTVLSAVEAGIAPGIAGEDIGIGPMPGPGGSGVVLVGGASIWIAAGKGDAETAAAWDFIRYLASPEVQSEWASVTGYVPIRQDAAEVEPLATTYAQDPRFKVAYDSLIETPDEPTAVGPLLGPQRAIRCSRHVRSRRSSAAATRDRPREAPHRRTPSSPSTTRPADASRRGPPLSCAPGDDS